MSYFYIIEHESTGIRYAGSRTSVNAHPAELLVKYFTSSNVVKNMIKAGEKFKIISVVEIEDPQITLEYEIRFLRENNCVKSDMWFNYHDGENIAPFGSSKYLKLLQSKFGNVTNISQTPENKKKVSEKLSGGINVWDEDNKTPVRITLEEYNNNRERYWHFSSVKYKEKYNPDPKHRKKTGGSTTYRIYDADGNLQVETKYFYDYCKQNDLPHARLQDSARFGGKPLYQNKLPDNRDFLKYKGWYALRG
jgi:hypothetical protein